MESISAMGSVALLLHPFRHTTPPPPQPPPTPTDHDAATLHLLIAKKLFSIWIKLLLVNLTFISLTLSVQLFYIVKVYVAALAAITLFSCSLHVFNCYLVDQRSFLGLFLCTQLRHLINEITIMFATILM